MKSKCQVCFARNPAEGSMRCARCASIPSDDATLAHALEARTRIDGTTPEEQP